MRRRILAKRVATKKEHGRNGESNTLIRKRRREAQKADGKKRSA